MTTTNDEFQRLVMGQVSMGRPFEPIVRRDPDGDCIEFIARPDAFFAERVDDLVTVYYSEVSGEIIGSVIKGVSKLERQLAESMPAFSVVIQDGRIRLEHLFLAAALASKPDPKGIAGITYRKLIEVADAAEVEAELCLT